MHYQAFVHFDPQRRVAGWRRWELFQVLFSLCLSLFVIPSVSVCLSVFLCLCLFVAFLCLFFVRVCTVYLAEDAELSWSLQCVCCTVCASVFLSVCFSLCLCSCLKMCLCLSCLSFLLCLCLYSLPRLGTQSCPGHCSMLAVRILKHCISRVKLKFSEQVSLGRTRENWKVWVRMATKGSHHE